MTSQDRKGPEGRSFVTPADQVTPELLARYDRPGPRYTSYPTAVEFNDAFTETDYRSRLEAANVRSGDPLSLYVHIPFCGHRCRFCGCNVVRTKKPEVVDAYLDSLLKEIDLLAAGLPDRRTLVQYHWGGGTPTYLSCTQIEKLQKKVLEHFRIDPNGEVAIEVDPRVTTEDQLRLLRELGFNRISLGVQDFTLRVQEAVNRVQPPGLTRSLIHLAREIGFGSVNIDLIYGLPLQEPATFGESLDRVIEMRPDRVAVYSFAYLPWLKPNQKSISKDALPDRETKFALFATAIRAFLAAGYHQIGMDHFALPEDEMARAVESRTLYRNFMGYTVHRAPDMLGAGITAIGEVQGAFAQNTRKLSIYSAALEDGRFPIERGYALSQDDKIRQRVILELMCNFYVSTGEISTQFGVDFNRYFHREVRDLQAEEGPEGEGFVRVSPEVIEVTPLGRLFIRNVAMVFDRYLHDKPPEKPKFSQTV